MRSPRCGLIRFGISFCLLSCVKEQLGRGQLVLVWRTLQQFVGFGVGRLFFRVGARKAEVAESVLFIEQQAIEERVLSIDAMTEHDVRNFVRDHRRQAGLIGQYVDQATAKHDGMADRKDSSVDVIRTRHRISG